MDKPRILVVDDDVEMQNTLPIFLRQILFACEVVVRGNGSDAIRELDNGEFHMIIQDLRMPGMDGFTVLAHAAKRYPKIVKIVLTGIADPAITRRVEQLGAIYLLKPPELKVLKLVINRELKNLLAALDGRKPAG